MIFKSFLSYLIGVVVGVLALYFYIAGNTHNMVITIIVGYIMSQTISKYIKTRMKNKYREILRGNK